MNRSASRTSRLAQPCGFAAQERRLADSNRWKRPIGNVPVLQEFRTRKPCYIEADRDFVTACWVWQGSLNSKGYALRGVDGKVQLVHRVVFEQTQRELEPGEQVHHLCEQKACVRPDHLAARDARAHIREHLPIPAALDEAMTVLREHGRLPLYAITDRLDRNPGTVSMAVRRGVAYGLIRRVRYGVYEAAV